MKLREFFMNARLGLSREDVESKSMKILSRVTGSKEYRESNFVHTYISIEKNNEVRTEPLINTCLEDGKKIVVPKIAGNGALNHVQLSSLDDLHVNAWGVPEPVDDTPFPLLKIGLVIVPMVAGDSFKNRLGYGKGYYDRFLNKCPAVTIGLLFDCQLYEKKLPVESFDVPLDILITESTRID